MLFDATVILKMEIPSSGEVLWGKKVRDDPRKSLKTTLKNTKP